MPSRIWIFKLWIYFANLDTNQPATFAEIRRPMPGIANRWKQSAIKESIPKTAVRR